MEFWVSNCRSSGKRILNRSQFIRVNWTNMYSFLSYVTMLTRRSTTCFAFLYFNHNCAYIYIYIHISLFRCADNMASLDSLFLSLSLLPFVPIDHHFGKSSWRHSEFTNCFSNCLFPDLWSAPLGWCRRGQRYFWILPDACGLRLCVRTHFKKGLVPYLSGGGTENK